MNRLLNILLAMAVLMSFAGCDSLDDDRVVGTCRIDLSMIGTWSIYGVNSVGDYKYFVKEKRIPSNFAYTATTYTGNGGVLLIGTTGTGTGGIVPAAYEMACPYCRKHSTLIAMDVCRFTHASLPWTLQRSRRIARCVRRGSMCCWAAVNQSAVRLTTNAIRCIAIVAHHRQTVDT